MALVRSRPILSMLIVAGLIAAYHAVRGTAESEPVLATRPELRPWELLGCYELEVDPWQLQGTSSDPEALIPAAPHHLMLLPDSLDEWGRDLDSYRARELATGESTESPDRVLRWLVQADTLWLLWSDRRVRAGIALFATENGFAGSGRAVVPEDSLTGIARAKAWRIHCATLARPFPRSWPRP